MFKHSNVDPIELAKFESLAARWWDPNSEFKPLHDINPLRLNYINRWCNGLMGKSVVDVGCGGGLLTEGMAVRGAQALGIDLGEAPLSVAELHALESGVNVKYRRISVYELAQEMPESFDVVTCMELLEHVPDPKDLVDTCARLVRPDGWVFFSTLNRNFKSFVFAIIGAEYVLGMLPQGTHRFDRFVKPSELASWVRQVDLEPKNITGINYEIFTRTYCLGGDLSINYLMACQKT